MNQLILATGELIEQALRSVETEFNRVSNGHWSLLWRNRVNHHLEVRRDGDWLTFTANETDNVSPKKLLDAATRNADLPAELRLSLNSTRQLELRSDLLLTEEIELGDRVRSVTDSVQRAWSGHPSPETSRSHDLEALENLCAEAGWSSVRRASGRLTVSLDASNSEQATIATRGEEVQLQASLIDLTDLNQRCRTASAVLAMEITRSSRMVRATANTDSNKLLFEIGWSVVPTVAELDTGFRALRDAVCAAGETFHALRSEELARDYMRIRGWSSKISSRKQKPTSNQKG